MQLLGLGKKSARQESSAAEIVEKGAVALEDAIQHVRNGRHDPKSGDAAVADEFGTQVSEATLTEEAGRPDVGPHRRKIGGRYSAQMWLTGLPLFVTDLAVMFFTIAAWRYISFWLNIGPGMDVSAYLIPIMTGYVLISAELGLYPGIRLSPVEEFRRLAVAITATFAMWSVGVFLLRGEEANPTWFLSICFVICITTMPIVRAWARRQLAKLSWWGFPALVCGDDAVAVNLFHWLGANRRLGLRPVGVIAEPDALEVDDDADWYVGSWSDAHRVAEQHDAYWAVVVPPENATEDLSESISKHLDTIPHIHVLSELTGLPDHWNKHQQVDGLTGIHLQQNLLLPFQRMTKRSIDFVASSVGGLLLLPILVTVAVAIKLSSPGPLFYGHERIGRSGRRFRAWKFRTMVQNADQVLEDYLQAHPELREEWEKDHKLRDDPRVTWIGRLIRKTSIDELPQLWNVIRGDMSLVGPRPIVTAEIAKYGEHYELYTFVLPGITGLWQVSGRNDTTYEERVKLDTYYIRNWSPWMDLYLLMRTVKTVLLAEGAY